MNYLSETIFTWISSMLDVVKTLDQILMAKMEAHLMASHLLCLLLRLRRIHRVQSGDLAVPLCLYHLRSHQEFPPQLPQHRHYLIHSHRNKALRLPGSLLCSLHPLQPRREASQSAHRRQGNLTRSLAASQMQALHRHPSLLFRLPAALCKRLNLLSQAQGLHHRRLRVASLCHTPLQGLASPLLLQ